MVESDRTRWDRKYAAGEGPAHFFPNQLLTDNRHLLTGGRALDVACGFGGSALYLASLGYRVDAVDISAVGLLRAQAEARQRSLRINFVQANLDHWWLPPSYYDVTVVFHYLNRSLMPRLITGLRPGGLFLLATRNTGYLSIRPEFDPLYLLEFGELNRFARHANLNIIHQADRTPHDPNLSQLIARRPCTP